MGDHEEGIVLTDREREALAGLAESIGDPWLARQLAGGNQATPPPQRSGRLTGRRLPLRAPAGWVGFLLVLAGAVLSVTTFVHSTALASLGLVMMGVGLWQFVLHQGGAIIRRLTAARLPVAAPSPPRTPPGAA